MPMLSMSSHWVSCVISRIHQFQDNPPVSEIRPHGKKLNLKQFQWMSLALDGMLLKYVWFNLVTAHLNKLKLDFSSPFGIYVF